MKREAGSNKIICKNQIAIKFFHGQEKF